MLACSPPIESLISFPGDFPTVAQQHVEIFHDNNTKYIIIRNHTYIIITVNHSPEMIYFCKKIYKYNSISIKNSMIYKIITIRI